MLTTLNMQKLALQITKFDEIIFLYLEIKLISKHLEVKVGYPIHQI